MEMITSWQWMMTRFVIACFVIVVLYLVEIVGLISLYSKPLPPSHFRQVFNSCPLQALFFKKAIEDMAACSLRCIAIAYRSYEIDKVPVGEQELSQWELPEDDLVLLAIIGLKV